MTREKQNVEPIIAPLSFQIFDESKMAESQPLPPIPMKSTNIGDAIAKSVEARKSATVVDQATNEIDDELEEGTINTKLAIQDIEAFFCSPTNHGKGMIKKQQNHVPNPVPTTNIAQPSGFQIFSDFDECKPTSDVSSLFCIITGLV